MTVTIKRFQKVSNPGRTVELAGYSISLTKNLFNKLRSKIEHRSGAVLATLASTS